VDLLPAERNLEDARAQCETWRTDGTPDVMAAHTMIDENVPLILIDLVPYNYGDALKEIKKRLDAGETAEEPESAPGDGKDMRTEFGDMSEATFVERLYVLGGHHVEGLIITSKAKRVYDGKRADMWSLEVTGPISVSFRIRDPYKKPMKHVQLQAQGDNFKEVFADAESRVKAELKKGTL
jgi:hypothetical protein